MLLVYFQKHDSPSIFALYGMPLRFTAILQGGGWMDDTVELVRPPLWCFLGEKVGAIPFELGLYGDLGSSDLYIESTRWL